MRRKTKRMMARQDTKLVLGAMIKSFGDRKWHACVLISITGVLIIYIRSKDDLLAEWNRPFNSIDRYSWKTC